MTKWDACDDCATRWMRHAPRMLSSWWLGAKKRLWSQCFWNSLFSAQLFQLIVMLGSEFSALGIEFFHFFILWKTFWGFLQLSTLDIHTGSSSDPQSSSLCGVFGRNTSCGEPTKDLNRGLMQADTAPFFLECRFLACRLAGLSKTSQKPHFREKSATPSQHRCVGILMASISLFYRIFVVVFRIS